MGSFGVLLHEIVSGSRPQGRDSMQPLRRAFHTALPWASCALFIVTHVLRGLV